MSTTARSVVVRLRAEMAQFKKEWNEGTGAVKGTREELGRTKQQSKQTETAISDLGTTVERNNARLKRHRAEWDMVGTTLLTTGAILTASGALMAKAAMDWETAWTGVLKTVETSPEKLVEIETGLRDLAKSMPTTHDDIAAVAEAAGQLNVAAEDVVDFTEVMVMLGDTTNLTADEAATSIAQLMNVMQTAPGDVDRLGATIVALGNKGASTERDIVQMAQRIAGAGEIVGLSEANVLALANAVSSSGIEVEAGGSAISSVLIDISKAVQTGSDDLATFAEVAGTSAEDFAARWKADPASALADFTEGLGRMSDNGENVFGVLDELGQSDIRVTRALLNMANAGDMLRTSLADGDAAWEENMALVEEAEKRYDTTAAKAAIAWNNIKDNAIDAGQGMLPVISGLSDVVTTLGGAFGALPDPVKSGLGLLAGGTGVALLVTGGFMKVLGSANDVNNALKTLELRSPRAAGALGRLAKAAGIAAVAVAGLRVLGDLIDYDDVASVSAYTEAILQLQGGTTDLDGILSNSKGISSRIKGYSDLAAAIKEADPSGINDKFGSVAGVIGMNPYQDAKDDIAAYDQALADLVARGATDQAAEGAAKFAAAAKESGRNAEDVERLLPGYTDALTDIKVEADLAADSQADLAGQSKALEMRLAEFGGGEDAAKIIADMGEKSAEAALSLLDLSESIDPAEASMSSWLEGLEKQAQALEEWADNVIKATTRGVDEGVVAKFEEMGAEGAARLDELVNGSQEDIDRLNGIWGDAGSAAMTYGEIVSTIQPYILTQFKTAGAEDAVDTAIKVANTYGLAPDVVRTILEANDYATKDIDRVLEGMRKADKARAKPKIDVETAWAEAKVRSLQRLINGMNGKTVRVAVEGGTGGGITTRADGGPIPGQGGPKQDNILVAASAGEHMWTALEVENAGGHGAMYAMRAEARAGKRPRYAVGGAIDDAWNESYRAAAAAYPAYSAPSVPGLPSAAPAALTGTLSASLAGARVEVGRDGLMQFVDGRVDLVMAANDSQKRGPRR